MRSKLGRLMAAESEIDALNASVTKAGLRGEPEAALVSGFCERVVAAGLPISRTSVSIDTLHPVYEGRLFRWGHDPSQPAVREYGRCPFRKFHPAQIRIVRQNHRIIESDVCNPARARNVCRRPVQVAEPA